MFGPNFILSLSSLFIFEVTWFKMAAPILTMMPALTFLSIFALSAISEDITTSKLIEKIDERSFDQYIAENERTLFFFGKYSACKEKIFAKVHELSMRVSVSNSTTEWAGRVTLELLGPCCWHAVWIFATQPLMHWANLDVFSLPVYTYLVIADIAIFCCCCCCLIKAKKDSSVQPMNS